MEDKLAVVNRIIEWHQTIRGHVKLVGDSVNDWEALLALDEARPDWVPGQTGALADKQGQLQQAMSFLEEGLQNHFAYEEKALPPLLGKLFMRALMLDHERIKSKIGEAKAMAAGAGLEGLSREELLSRETQIQETINNLCQLVEEHAGREEVLLEMMQKALQEK